MLPHHQAAIDMGKTQLAYGQDAQMRRLAQEIITDQQSEIELMQLWLRQREAKSSTVKHSPGIHTGFVGFRHENATVVPGKTYSRP
jgi:hypothetical protein